VGGRVNVTYGDCREQKTAWLPGASFASWLRKQEPQRAAGSLPGMRLDDEDVAGGRRGHSAFRGFRGQSPAGVLT
jgi:hypothetical protein